MEAPYQYTLASVQRAIDVALQANAQLPPEQQTAKAQAAHEAVQRVVDAHTAEGWEFMGFDLVNYQDDTGADWRMQVAVFRAPRRARGRRAGD
jgi:hypothetical protein